MTKTKSRKSNTKQAKKAKTVSTADAINGGTEAWTEEIKKDAEKERENLVREELRCGDDEKVELLENTEQENKNDERWRQKLKMKSVGRVLVLILVTILAFVTRYYNLREPKHVW